MYWSSSFINYICNLFYLLSYLHKTSTEVLKTNFAKSSGVSLKNELKKNTIKIN